MNDSGEPDATAEKHFRRVARSGGAASVRYSVLDEESTTAAVVDARTANLSVRGAFIPSETPLPIGTALRLRLTVAASKEPGEIRGPGEIWVRGTVRWVASGPDDDPRGMGVHFVGLDDATLAVLEEHCASVVPTLDHDDGA